MTVELNFINVPEPEPVNPIENIMPKEEPERIKYGRMEHRINSRGDGVECYSAADSWCRHAPLCDTEFWMHTGCDLHDEEHKPQPGQPCWLIQWINNDELEECYVEPSEPVEIKPGALVEIEYEGDYAIWEYEGDHDAA